MIDYSEDFTIEIDDVTCRVERFDLSDEDVQFKVSQNGEELFTLKFCLDKSEIECWQLTEPEKYPGIDDEFVLNIGDEIDSYYE